MRNLRIKSFLEEQLIDSRVKFSSMSSIEKGIEISENGLLFLGKDRELGDGILALRSNDTHNQTISSCYSLISSAQY